MPTTSAVAMVAKEKNRRTESSEYVANDDEWMGKRVLEASMTPTMLSAVAMMTNEREMCLRKRRTASTTSTMMAAAAITRTVRGEDRGRENTVSRTGGIQTEQQWCYDRFSSPVGTENRGGSEVKEILTTVYREFGGCAHRCAGKLKHREQD